MRGDTHTLMVPTGVALLFIYILCTMFQEINALKKSSKKKLQRKEKETVNKTKNSFFLKYTYLKQEREFTYARPTPGWYVHLDENHYT